MEPLAWELPYAVGVALKKEKKINEAMSMGHTWDTHCVPVIVGGP